MRCIVALLSGAVLIAAVLAPAPAASGGTARYAGTVRTIDHGQGSMVLEDVGPWLGASESPITPRAVTVSPATGFFIADRSPLAPTGYQGDYVERKAQLSDVRNGAFVVVECEREGAGCLAQRIVVVRHHGGDR
jgi:hypothetical protein